MSADNRLCLMQDRWGQWRVWNGSASMLYDEPPFSAKAFETEEAALAYMETRRDDYFEYGHQAIGTDEQRVALQSIIADATERLNRLDKTGSQWQSQQS